MIRILLLAAAGAIAFGGILFQHKERGFAIAALLAACTLVEGVFTEWAADYVWAIFPSESSAVVSEQAPGEEARSVQQSAAPEVFPDRDSGPGKESEPTPAPEVESKPAPAPEPEPEPVDPLSGLTDISGQNAVSGSVTEKGQVNQYRYTAAVDGVYRFDSGLSFGALNLQLDNAYGGRLDGNAGGNIVIDLEAGKTYILNVSYNNKPMDYTIQIGVPNPVTDITGQTSVSGSLTYSKQVDRYTYTAPVSGVYGFDDPRLNFGALTLEVQNAQGQCLRSGYPSMTLTLEEGKTYTLWIEAGTYLLDYTIQIYIPNRPVDITTQGAASGTLTFNGQKDQYYYTAPADGSYSIHKVEGSKSMTLEVRDESGKYYKSGLSSVTVTLSGGTQYIVYVYQEYTVLPLEYAFEITAEAP